MSSYTLSTPLAGNVCALSLAAVAHLIIIFSDPVLGDELAVISHQETAVFEEHARGTSELSDHVGHLWRQ